MLRRPLILLVVALAALGSVVQGAQAAAPAMGMVAAQADVASFCDGCAGSDGSPATCGSGVCPFTPALPSSIAFQVVATAHARPAAYFPGGASRARPPDPFPPRRPTV